MRFPCFFVFFSLDISGGSNPAHKKRKHQETLGSLMFSGGEKTLA
jgi:hypothetical protein